MKEKESGNKKDYLKNDVIREGMLDHFCHIFGLLKKKK